MKRVTVVTRQRCPTTSQCYRTDYSAFLCSRIRGRPSCNPCAKWCQHDSRVDSTVRLSFYFVVFKEGPCRILSATRDYKYIRQYIS